MSICFGATVAIFSWYRPGVPSGLSTSTRSYVYFIFAFGSPQHAHDDEFRAHRDPSFESSVCTMLNATQHDGSVQYAGTHHRQQQPNGQSARDDGGQARRSEPLRRWRAAHCSGS